jgi:hypothetical protein
MLFELEAQLARASLLVASGRHDDASSIFDLVRRESRRRGLPAVNARLELIEARSLLLRACPEAAARVAGENAEAARSIANLPIETESCALWLEAARAAGLPEQVAVFDRLTDCIQALSKHVQTPDLQNWFSQKQKAWTKSP